MKLILTAVLGAFWGVLWALTLSTPLGLFLARRHTWLAVVIGVGVDLLILLIVLPFDYWLATVYVIGASSIGIITRSLLIEWRDHRELLEAFDGHPHPDRE